MELKNQTKSKINSLAYDIVGASIEVHKEFGPGLLEDIYEEALYLELLNRDFFVQRQMEVPVYYKGVKCRNNLRLDLLVEDAIIVECKSCDTLHPIHEAQLLTYMKLSEKPKGLLINFNVTNITKEGLRPFVNELFRILPE
jgi:GxxExxY protein